MGYAARVRGLEACPFCKEMFPAGEQTDCPLCGVKLIAASKLPDAGDEPDDEGEARGALVEKPLPWTYWGKARGPLALLSVLGLVAFCAPWVNSYAPELTVFTGIDIARRTGVAWSAGVAWFTLLPLVLSRRTVRQMRGARLAIAVLAAIPAIVALTMLLNPPQAAEARGVLVRLRYAWAPGIYATLGLGLVTAAVAALRFGGPAEDIRINAPAASDHTLN